MNDKHQVPVPPYRGDAVEACVTCVLHAQVGALRAECVAICTATTTLPMCPAAMATGRHRGGALQEHATRLTTATAITCRCARATGWPWSIANPGHDIGQVALTGMLVKMQMKRVNLVPMPRFCACSARRVPSTWSATRRQKREQDTMIRSRQIALDLGLKMKIGDVEYQGDGNKGHLLLYRRRTRGLPANSSRCWPTCLRFAWK